MRIELGEGTDATEVHLHGDIDFAVEQELTAMLKDLSVFGLPVIVDMAEVTFLDSSGIRVLLVAQQAFEHEGASILLRAVPESVRRILEIAGVEKLLPTTT